MKATCFFCLLRLLAAAPVARAGCGKSKCGYIFPNLSAIKSYSGSYRGSGRGMTDKQCAAKCDANAQCWGYTSGGSLSNGTRYWWCDLFSNATAKDLRRHTRSGAVSCSAFCYAR